MGKVYAIDEKLAAWIEVERIADSCGLSAL